mgnify:CR=1 FL=1
MEDTHPEVNDISQFPLDINQIIDVINNLKEGVYGVDLKGNCIFYNHTSKELLGYSHVDQLIGQNMHTLIHHSHEDDTCKETDQQESTYELVYRIIKGSRYPFYVKDYVSVTRELVGKLLV